MARLEIGPYDGPDTYYMDREWWPSQAKVTLSRRNLLALLHKLDMPDSARRLENNVVFVEGEHTEDMILILCCCEDDAEHYADARRHGALPGEMHPDTETFIQTEGPDA